MVERDIAGVLPGPPREQAQDEQEVPDLGSELEIPNGQVEPGVDGRCGGRLEPAHRPALGAGQSRADDHRHDQDAEDGTEQVGQPARPADLGAQDTPADPEPDRPGQEVGQAAWPDHPGGIVDRPREGEAEQEDEPDRQPALGRCELDRALVGRCRPSRPERRGGHRLTPPAARRGGAPPRSGRPAGRARPMHSGGPEPRPRATTRHHRRPRRRPGPAPGTGWRSPARR